MDTSFDFDDFYEQKKSLKKFKSIHPTKGNSYKRFAKVDDFYEYNPEYQDYHKTKHSRFYLDCKQRNGYLDKSLASEWTNKIKYNFESYIKNENKDAFIDMLNNKKEVEDNNTKPTKNKKQIIQDNDEYYFKYSSKSKRKNKYDKINLFEKSNPEESLKKTQSANKPNFYAQIQNKRSQVKQERMNKQDMCICSFDINLKKKTVEIEKSYKLSSYNRYCRDSVGDRYLRHDWYNFERSIRKSKKLENEFYFDDFSLVKSKKSHNNTTALNVFEQFKQKLISTKILNFLKELDFSKTDLYFEPILGIKSFIDQALLNQKFYQHLQYSIRCSNQIDSITFGSIYSHEFCDVCCSDDKEIFQLNLCKHKACIECWQQYINDSIYSFTTTTSSSDSAIVNPISCLFYKCSTKLVARKIYFIF
jgi:hypothetical protein